MSDEYERRPTCPPWCMGHLAVERQQGENLTHTNESRFTDTREVAVTVVFCPAMHKAPTVLVMSQVRDGKPARVVLALRDATALAAVLDIEGASVLAGLLREAVALVGRHAAPPTTTETDQ